MNTVSENPCRAFFRTVRAKVLSSRLDIKGLFLSPLLILLMLEVMHLCYPMAIPSYFISLHFLTKWGLTYLFLLAAEAGILVLVHSLRWAHTITAVLFFFMNLASDIVCIITGDPLLPTDFLLMGTLGEITSFVEIPVLLQHIFAFFILIWTIVWYFKRQKKRGKAKIGLKARLAFMVLGVCFCAYVLYLNCFDYTYRHVVLRKCDVSCSAFYARGDYLQNGLILTFFPRIGDIFVEAPADYSQNTMAQIRENYPAIGEADHDMRDNPNIIAIQSEAWWDPTLLPNVEISVDPMENTRKLMQEGFGGETVSPVFGGATCMPEFEFLTGFSTKFLPVNIYPYIQSITSQTPSLASACAAEGYQTVAYHPYRKNFYGRHKAYPLLGFQEYYGDADLEEPAFSGFYISDMQMTEDIIRLYENKTEERLFLFGVSMQNHGGYENPRYEAYDVELTSEVLSEADLAGLKDYAQGVYETDQALKALIDYFRTVDEPTVIVMYGDHLPLLGTDGSTYRESGFVENEEVFEYSKFEQLYHTPYVVWANYNIRGKAQFPTQISPGNLGVQIASLAHVDRTLWYYSFLREFYEHYPVYENSAIKNTALETVDTVSEDDTQLEAKFRLIMFDIINGKQYAR